jgi:hypothetical protein
MLKVDEDMAANGVQWQLNLAQAAKMSEGEPS